MLCSNHCMWDTGYNISLKLEVGCDSTYFLKALFGLELVFNIFLIQSFSRGTQNNKSTYSKCQTIPLSNVRRLCIQGMA